jgi:hypothetical protein
VSYPIPTKTKCERKGERRPRRSLCVCVYVPRQLWCMCDAFQSVKNVASHDDAHRRGKQSVRLSDRGV